MARGFPNSSAAISVIYVNLDRLMCKPLHFPYPLEFLFGGPSTASPEGLPYGRTFNVTDHSNLEWFEHSRF
jgi:hypothetical protein